MKILYFSSLWSGLRPILFEGKTETSGMPAFIEPLKALIEAGHEVNIVFIHKRPIPSLNRGPEWLRQLNLEFVDRKGDSGSRRPQFLVSVAEPAISRFRPDFVYLQGTTAAPLWRMLSKRGIPCGQRVYGVDDFYRRHRLVPRFALRFLRSNSWAAFNGTKAFVLVTNDGSFGDKVCEKLNPNPDFEFRFWLNGFTPPEDLVEMPAPARDEPPYLFCPARFAYMQAKERTAESLHCMHRSGYPQMRLKVAGQPTSEESRKLFWNAVKRFGLERQVDYLGEIPRDEVRRRCREAIAVLSLYRFSNLSNVALETLSVGGLILAIQDESLGELVTSGEDALLGADVAELSRVFARGLEAHNLDDLRRGALLTARRKLNSWNERSRREMSLINHALNQRNR